MDEGITFLMLELGKRRCMLLELAEAQMTYMAWFLVAQAGVPSCSPS